MSAVVITGGLVPPVENVISLVFQDQNVIDYQRDMENQLRSGDFPLLQLTG